MEEEKEEEDEIEDRGQTGSLTDVMSNTSCSNNYKLFIVFNLSLHS